MAYSKDNSSSRNGGGSKGGYKGNNRSNSGGKKEFGKSSDNGGYKKRSGESGGYEKRSNDTSSSTGGYKKTYNDKPFGEKRTSGSGEKRSFDKPFGEKRNFDKPFEKRNDKPFGEKRNFDKPYEKREGGNGEKRSFDKRNDSTSNRFGKRPRINSDFKRKTSDSDLSDDKFVKKFVTNDNDLRNNKSSERSFEKRSFDKPYGEKRSFDKPYGEKRNFDKPYEKRESGSGEKRSFDKPYEKRESGSGEKRSFDKPYEKRESGSGEKRSFDKPYEKREGGSFEKRNDKPFGEKRNFDKPYEKREGGSFEKRNFDKPYEKRESGSFEKRNFDKPYEKRESGSGEKRSFDKPYEKREGGNSTYKKRETSGKIEGGTSKYIKREGEDGYKKRGVDGIREGGITDKPYVKRENSDKPYEKKEFKGKFGDKPTDKKESYKKKTNETEGEILEKDGFRLNRFIANAGICSRREADELIANGQITINGKIVTEMGYKVQETDDIRYQGEKLNREQMVYVLLNKPKDHITTTDDPEGRKTVMNLVQQAGDERIYPVGRLDRNTTGLLLLTNDGKLADKLSHPSGNVHKVYEVLLDKPVEDAHVETLLHGFELEDGFTRFDKVSVISPDGMVLSLAIHSGKNRIVRRMFAHLGYEVDKLDRVQYSGLTKKNLERGKWRFLTAQEIIRLKHFVK